MPGKIIYMQVSSCIQNRAVLKQTQKEMYLHFVSLISLISLLVVESASNPLPGVYIQFQESKLFQLSQLKEETKING